MNINTVTIGGTITRDPSLRHIPSGMSVLDLSIAINDRYKGKDGEARETTTYVEVQVWGKTADACAQHLRKGSQAVVEGKLQLDTWEKNGEKRSKIRVRADRVHFVGGRADNGSTPASTPAPAGSSGSGAGPDDDIPFSPF